MAAPTLSTSQQLNTTLKGQKQNKKSLRNVLTSPYVFTRPELSKSSQEEIIKALRKTFTTIDLKRSRIKNKRGKTKTLETDEVTEEKKLPNEEPPRITNLRSQITAGVNAVSRGLERDELRVVLVDQGTRPPLLTRHILTTAALRACPVLVINNLAKTLAPLLDVSSLAAVGLKKLSEDDEADFTPLVELLVEHAVPLNIPWLHPPGPPTTMEPDYTQTEDGHVTQSTTIEHTQTVRKTETQTTAKSTPPEAVSVRPVVKPPPLPAVDFDSIYVKVTDSVLTGGKVKPSDFGTAGFLAFGDSSDDEESPTLQTPKKIKKVGKTKAVKRKSAQIDVEYETPRIGKIKSNDKRVSTKSKKKKK